MNPKIKTGKGLLHSAALNSTIESDQGRAAHVYQTRGKEARVIWGMGQEVVP